LSDLFVFNLVFLFALGACFGSFANVVIYRYPLGESLWGRSRCSHCKRQIPWYQNVPMFAYFFLRGRCSQCSQKFSIRYPLVEFLTACLFSLVYYYYGDSFLTVEYLILVLGLVIGSFIDWDHMILPDMITLGGCVLGLIGAFLNPERSFLDAFFGVLFGGGVLWLVAYVYYVFTGREGLGGGDIKLMAWLGSLLGWKAIPFIILSSSILGSVVGLLMTYQHNKNMQSTNSENKLKEKMQMMIPFGPFIAIGALLYLFGLKSVGLWYIDLFFPALTP
jgi:leader peptidase (prepilin peptidase)/N-methyltransferase